MIQLFLSGLLIGLLAGAVLGRIERRHRLFLRRAWQRRRWTGPERDIEHSWSPFDDI